jgi:phenylalanyl-tRNA synthetase beta chain
MDIKLPTSLLRDYLKTKASSATVAEYLTLCGPTVDRIHKLKNDSVWDIEVITNRIDMASAIGIAREAAAILPEFGLKAELTDDPYQQKKLKYKVGKDSLPLNVQIMDQSLVSRFAAIVLNNVSVGPSDPQTVALLEKSGQRSVNNIVDISNEITLRWGQPVHIFDYDRLEGHKLILRTSRKGETITTLDGQTHKLQGNDIVIADDSGQLVDLCGIMGGQSSKVDSQTKRVVLFVQTYEPRRIRATSLYLQHRTLAAQLFEKGLDPELVRPSLDLGVELLGKRAGATVAGELIDIYPRQAKAKPILLSLAWLEKLSGLKLSQAKVVGSLRRLGFKVEGKLNLTVTPPSWRREDIKLKEDLAEEVLRLHGYFRLPQELPTTQLGLIETDPLLKLERYSRHFFADSGFTEIYNYSLVDQDSLEKAGLDASEAAAINNPLSEDYTHLRTSLLPQMLVTLAKNQALKDDSGRYFEISNVYLNWDGRNLPEEQSQLVVASSALDYRQLKGTLEIWLDKLNLPQVEFAFGEDDSLQPAAQITVAGKPVGKIGLVAPKVAASFQLRQAVPAAQINLAALAEFAFGPHSYKPISELPDVIEEITFNSNLPLGKLKTKIEEFDPLIAKVEYLDSLADKHSFRLYFRSAKDNLSKELVGEIKQRLLKSF